MHLQPERSFTAQHNIQESTEPKETLEIKILGLQSRHLTGSLEHIEPKRPFSVLAFPNKLKKLDRGWARKKQALSVSYCSKSVAPGSSSGLLSQRTDPACSNAL
uniref:Uncharacterized protein n=1 Tax=Micrurus spixii TaxID=129469 RepID=A0A2D4NEL7_9SAUR